MNLARSGLGHDRSGRIDDTKTDEDDTSLGGAAFLLLCAGTALAQIQPVTNPNGTMVGSIDGHAFDLPVFCHTFVGPLDASSHDQPVSNNVSVGGVEPVVNLVAFETGYQFVAFIGGEHYKVLRATDKIKALPFMVSRQTRSRKRDTVELELTLDCDARP